MIFNFQKSLAKERNQVECKNTHMQVLYNYLTILCPAGKLTEPLSSFKLFIQCKVHCLDHKRLHWMSSVRLMQVIPPRNISLKFLLILYFHLCLGLQNILSPPRVSFTFLYYMHIFQMYAVAV